MRTYNSAATVAGTLDALRRQTVPVELVVVDSGSTDATPELVQGRCDHLLRLAPGSYRPGRALNAAAAIAAGEIVGAFSSHCRPPDEGWLNASLALYDDERVAATGGASRDPAGRDLDGVYLQTAADARANPYWGFSNHASTWRASVWREFPFSETLPTVEDKEWSARVLEAGWRIAFHPALEVDMQHRWRQGTLNFFRRERLEMAILGGIYELPPYGPADLLAEWWRPPNPRHRLARERLNPRRMAGLTGRYLGHRRARRGRG